MQSDLFAPYSEAVGILGVVLVMIGYFALQTNRMKSDSFTFSMINLLGSVFILVSLLYDWNLASFLMEAAWAVLSFYGLAKAFRTVA